MQRPADLAIGTPSTPVKPSSSISPGCSDPSTASPELNSLGVRGKDSLDKKGNPQKVSKGVTPPGIRALVLFYPLSPSFLVCGILGVLTTL